MYIDVRQTKITAPRIIGLVTIDADYLCKNTNINANNTNAQRMPPSPSNKVENKEKSFDIERNDFHKKLYNHSNERRLFQYDVFVAKLSSGYSFG
jgi:hypothetical protein